MEVTVNELLFQEMMIAERPPLEGLAELITPSGPSVMLSPPVEHPYAKLPVGGRLGMELRVLQPRILTKMPIRGGLIVRVGIHEAENPDDEGRPRQKFINIDVVGSGPVPSLAAFSAMPLLPELPRAPQGWVARSLFIWVTR